MAAEISDSRLAALNELRGEVLSDRALFVRKDQYELERRGDEKRLGELERWKARMDGVVLVLAGLSTLAVTIASIVTVLQTF